MSKRPPFTLTLTVGAANSLAAAGSVTFWNTVAAKALSPKQGTNPVGQSRTYAIRYETTSLTLPGICRSFRGSSDAAEENGNSRVFAGIHSPHAVRDGHRQGRSIERAVGKLLQPVRKAPDNY
jgi:hypothetical protein